MSKINTNNRTRYCLWHICPIIKFDVWVDYEYTY